MLKTVIVLNTVVVFLEVLTVVILFVQNCCVKSEIKDRRLVHQKRRLSGCSIVGLPLLAEFITLVWNIRVLFSLRVSIE